MPVLEFLIPAPPIKDLQPGASPARTRRHGNCRMHSSLFARLNETFARIDRRALPWDALLLTVCLGAAITLYAIYFPNPVFTVDDAYITLNNARLLGGGSTTQAFEAGALMGSTSVVHVGMIVLLGTVMSVEMAALVIAWLAAAALGFGVLFLARGVGAPRWVALVLSLATLLAGSEPIKLLNGLETGLAMAAVAWTLCACVYGWTRVLAILCGTLPFVRPEFSALSGLLIGAVAIERVRNRTFDDLVRFLGYSLLAAMPWMIWLFVETGVVWPSTVGAKRAFFAEAQNPLIWKLTFVARGIADFAVDIGPLFIGIFLLGWNRVAGSKYSVWPLWLFTGVFFAVYGMYFPRGLMHYDNRYLYIFVPILVLGLSGAITSARPLVRWSAKFVTIISLGFGILSLPHNLREYVVWRNFVTVELQGVAEWVRVNVPRNDSVLVDAAGYMGWWSQRRLVDLVGLKTPTAVQFHERLTYPSGGALRGLAISEIAARYQPRWAVFYQPWERAYHLVDGLERNGWRLTDVRGKGLYRVYRLDPPQLGSKTTRP